MQQTRFDVFRVTFLAVASFVCWEICLFIFPLVTFLYFGISFYGDVFLLIVPLVNFLYFGISFC